MNTIKKITEELIQGDEFELAGQPCVIIESIKPNENDEYVVQIAFITGAVYGTVVLPKSMRFDVIPSTL